MRRAIVHKQGVGPVVSTEIASRARITCVISLIDMASSATRPLHRLMTLSTSCVDAGRRRCILTASKQRAADRSARVLNKQDRCRGQCDNSRHRPVVTANRIPCLFCGKWRGASCQCKRYSASARSRECVEHERELCR